ncbi:MAG: WYL domain-containing protein [Lachnospiraceae bacterium]|nr:WYL domain-containing protein [Lachnospiraceae bacterium]
MPKSYGQKLKLLYLLQLLESESCEEYPVTTSRMIEYLESKGIHSERKSIYDDMEKLRDFGYDILQVSSRIGGGYYLGAREFELAELKLLVDAVQASRFITEKKTRDLIKKLEKKAGMHDAGKLQRQVVVVGRAKAENEGIYYNVDAIYRAIQENCRISFVYMEWNLKKEMVPRSGERRTVSPWSLIWQNENYYLVAYDAKAGEIRHFRVDKMGQAALEKEPREGQEIFEKTDQASYSREVFGMFGGKTETVTLQMDDYLIGVVIDRFGKDVSIRRDENGRVRARVKVAVSGQFFGWLAGIGRSVRIVSPESVREEYRLYLLGILDAQNK